MHNAARQLRFVTRSLLRQPLFSALVVTVLALGIGASTAIFSVVYSVALDPLPWPEAQRLVAFHEIRPEVPEGRGRSAFLLNNVRHFKENSRHYDGIAAHWEDNWTLTGRETPRTMRVSRVSPDLFVTLGVSPAIGRGFTNEEVAAGEEQLAVLSARTARQLFGDEDPLGATLQLDGRAFSVIGVMPASFEFPDGATELWVPLWWRPDPDENVVREIMLPVIGRLAEGVTSAQAEAEANIFLAQLNDSRFQAMQERRQRQLEEDLESETNETAGEPTVRRRARGERSTGGSERAERAGPTRRGPRVSDDIPTEPSPPSTLELRNLLEEQVAPVRPAIRLLAGAVALLLLIACANVGNLLLSRGLSRQRELATRAALGASRGRLVGLLLSESAILATLGGVLGIVLAWIGVRLLLQLDPGDIPRLGAIGIQPIVGLFALGTAVLCGVAVGLLPAAQTRFDRLVASLGREGGEVRGGRSVQSRLRSTLVVSEVALALVLLVGASLLSFSFLEMSRVDPGYRAEGVLAAELPAPLERYPAGPQRTSFFRSYLERVQALPGVESAALVNFLPPFPGRIMLSLQIEGRAQSSDARDVPTADLRVASSDYFKTLGIPLLEGRIFDDEDREAGPMTVVINRAFAEAYFPDEEAVGARLAGFGEIVGVVGNVRPGGYDSTTGPMYYVPVSQIPDMLTSVLRRMSIAVRADAPLELVPLLRTTLQNLDPLIPLDNVELVEDRLGATVAQPRFYAAVLAVFAELALVLALVGVYGLMTFTVRQRERETGIRMALGEGQRRALRRALGFGIRHALVGVGVGVLGALALRQVLGGMLFGIEASDVRPYILVALLLVATAALASYLPARRAARTDPMSSLRHE